MTAQCRSNNPFPAGECTQYASERYHQLTGCYVPWNGNAKDWAANAPAFGWTVSSTAVAPSIICLGAGVQLADPTYGHVSVAESLNNDGTVNATSLNWGLTAAQRAQVSHQVFHPGAGVSFITNGRAANNPQPNNGQGVPLTVGHFMYEVLLNLANNVGYKPTANINNFMNAWAASEGGGVTNGCKWNPLNTMQKEPGSTNCTNIGIQAYPDPATGLKGTVDALNNGNYGSLVHALVTNDELNLGFTRRGAPSYSNMMAANIAGDLGVWLSGSRTMTTHTQQYILSIMQMAGINNPTIEGGSIQGGPGNTTGQQYGQKQLGGTTGDVGPPGSPTTSQIQNAVNDITNINSFFGNLNSFFSNPMRIVYILGGGAMVITGMVLLVKSFEGGAVKGMLGG